jgi:type VI secretion system protein VasJ
VKQDIPWIWAAAGKHPAVKDYIRLGQDTPVMGAFSRWVEVGFSRVSRDTAQHSWRFFARGSQREELVCGLVRDSRDGAGRPFPFLILGTGTLEGWEHQWVNLPDACDGPWERMEFLCMKRIFDLEELKGDIIRLPRPSLKGEGQPGAESPEGSLIPPQDSGMVSIPLAGTGDHREESVHLLKLMDARYHTVPDAVFIGGAIEHAFLAGFFRPLNTADFMRLWTP